MAKRTSKKSKRSRRRRRIGALALNLNSPLVKAGVVAVGYFVGAPIINPMIDKVTAGKISPKIIAAGQTGLGGLLLLGKGRTNILKTAAGGLLAGSGLKRALIEFGVVSPPVATIPASTVTGYGRVPVIGSYGKVPVIGSYESPGTLAGYPPANVGSYMSPGTIGRAGRVMGSTHPQGSDLNSN